MCVIQNLSRASVQLHCGARQDSDARSVRDSKAKKTVERRMTRGGTAYTQRFLARGAGLPALYLAFNK